VSSANLVAHLFSQNPKNEMRWYIQFLKVLKKGATFSKTAKLCIVSNTKAKIN